MSKQKGFTLIELLLYIGISAIVLLSLSVFYSTLLNARVRRETVAEVDEQGAAVMNLMTQAVRNAQEITVPALGESSGSLTMVVDEPTDSPLVFSVSDGALLITEGAGEPVALTNSRVVVTDLQIENLSRSGTPGNARITFTLSRDSDSARHEYDYVRTFEGSASLRQP